ncbi:hypothetical protein KAR91_42680, partial [Candidatus Pacearchaeota archaeon]|nr:hypothetical protein [Candidatus Pacearchaeota archaeon]
HVSKGVVGPANLIQYNYGSCIEKISREASVATVGLEKSLKGTSAKQKNRAFNRKMQSLLSKMTKMHNGMVELREKIDAFDANLPCYAAKCD